MKKFTALLLVCCMLLSLFIGCNSAVDNDQSEASDDPTQAATDATEKATKKATEKATQKENNKMPNRNENPETLKILTIGNSFSDDTMQYVYKIAKSAGVESIKLGNLYIGGCSLNTHAANARENKGAYDYRTNSNDAWVNTPNFKMKDALLSEDWDIVSLQQASGSSGIADTYAELEYLIGYVKEHAPMAKIVWNMTWAYQQDSTHNEFPKYESNQMTMYESILDAVQTKITGNEDISVIVPCGTAIQNARTSYVGDTLTRDGFHLSLGLGRYIAGLTFFFATTGISIAEVDYMPDGVDADTLKIAIESATNAVLCPFVITYSEYDEAPVFDESLYDVLDLDLTVLGYWNSSSGSMAIDTKSSNAHQYAATRLLTPDDIPAGSVIVIADGWKYRPDAWKSVGAQSSRPDNVTTSRIVVTEQWWGEYIYRGFNISKADGSTLSGLSAADINAVFKIYVPKNS